MAEVSRYKSGKGGKILIMAQLLLLLVTQVWVLVDLVHGIEDLYIPDARVQDQQRRVQEKNPCKLQNNNYCFEYSDETFNRKIKQ